MSSTKSPRIYKSKTPSVQVIRKSIFSYLFNTADNFDPELPAFIDAESGETLSRGQLKDLSLRLAWGLRHKVSLPLATTSLSLNRGDMVMIMSPNSLSWPIALFGCVAAGFRITFASSSATPRELSLQWDDSKSRLLIIHPSLLQVAKDMFSLLKIPESESKQKIWVIDRLWAHNAPGHANCNNLGELIQKDKITVEEKFDGMDADETVYVCYSSGTTGRPKGVETTHKNISTVLGTTKAIWSEIETEQDVYIGILPVYHMFGLSMILHYPIFRGKPMVLMDGFSIEPFCKVVEKYSVTTLMLVPPIILELSMHPAVDRYDISSLTNVASGGAPLSPALAKKFLDRLRDRGALVYLLQGCGSTETTCPAQIVAPFDSVKKFGSIGQLVPTIEARLIDERGEDVEDGVPGEMWLRGPTIMKSYLNNPAATAAAFTSDGWYKTGDVFTRDTDGYFYILDRKKEMIKYKGHQVAPAELEAILMENPEILDAGVVGVMNEYTGDELPRAYVTPANASILTSISEKDAFAKRVQKWVESQVAYYKFLRGGVVVLESIPKSATGKILRKELRELAAAEQKKNHRRISSRL